MSELQEIVSQLDEDDDSEKFSDNFIALKILGKGSFGIVLACKQKLDQKVYAVKIIRKSGNDPTKYAKVLQEAEILRQLNHPNIVKLHRISETQTKLILVMEWVQGGELKQLINSRYGASKPFSEDESRTIMKSIFSAVYYIHQRDILHRDLKPENILLGDKEDLSTIKICDFGLAGQLQSENMINQSTMQDTCGTKIFMSPELWNKSKYTKICGVVGLSCIIYSLENILCIKRATQKKCMYKNCRMMYGKFPLILAPKHIFTRLVYYNPRGRYSAGEALEHPWIKNTNESPGMTTFEQLRANTNAEKLYRFMVAIMLLEKLKNEHRKFDIKYLDKLEAYSKPFSDKPKSILENLITSLNSPNGSRDNSPAVDSVQKTFAKLRYVYKEDILHDNNNSPKVGVGLIDTSGNSPIRARTQSKANYSPVIQNQRSTISKLSLGGPIKATRSYSDAHKESDGNLSNDSDTSVGKRSSSRVIIKIAAQENDKNKKSRFFPEEKKHHHHALTEIGSHQDFIIKTNPSSAKHASKKTVDILATHLMSPTASSIRLGPPQLKPKLDTGLHSPAVELMRKNRGNSRSFFNLADLDHNRNAESLDGENLGLINSLDMNKNHYTPSPNRVTLANDEFNTKGFNRSFFSRNLQDGSPKGNSSGYEESSNSKIRKGCTFTIDLDKEESMILGSSVEFLDASENMMGYFNC